MNLTRKIRSILTATACFVIMNLISCSADSPTDLTKESIIPKPVSVTATGEVFIFRGITLNLRRQAIILQQFSGRSPVLS
jgi:hypothetical protein